MTGFHTVTLLRVLRTRSQDVSRLERLRRLVLDLPPSPPSPSPRRRPAPGAQT